MTLKQSIDITLQKYYNSSCYEVLGLYFALPELINRLTETQKKDVEKKFSEEGCIKTAFCRGPARDFIKNMGKGDVVDIMRKELSLPFTWTGSIGELISMYAKKYDQIKEKSYDKEKIIVPVDDFEKFILSVNNLLHTYSEYTVKQILTQNMNNLKIREFILKGSEYIKNNNVEYYSLDDIDAFMLFANDRYNYYSNYKSDMASKTSINFGKDMDILMNLNVNNTYKSHALYELYTGSGDLLQYLPNKIDDRSVKYSVLDNAVRSAIINLDFQEQYRQRDLYNGLNNQQINQLTFKLNEIIGKLLNKDYQELGKEEININAEELYNNVSQLEEQDIKFLCQLYVITNTSKKSKEILSIAASRTSYLLPSEKTQGIIIALSDNDISENAKKYGNLSKVLSTIESQEFINNLGNKYYK